MVSRMCFSPRSDFQSFFKVFTQISPRDDTLGWKIFVRKKPVKYDEVRYVMHTYSRRYICRNAGNCHNTGAFSQKTIKAISDDVKGSTEFTKKIRSMGITHNTRTFKRQLHNTGNKAIT